MSQQLPNTAPTEVEITTRDREHLSSVLFRVLGFVNAEVFADTLERNPHLAELPLLYPENTKITIALNIEPSNEQQVQTLW